MIGSPEARPYVVTIEDGGGVQVDVKVLAYDITEALMAANLEISGAGGEVARMISVRPDEEALACRAKRFATDVVVAALLRPDPKKDEGP